MRDLIDYFLIKLKNTRSTFILILCAFCFLLPFKMIYCNILSIVLLSIVILLSIINKKVYFNGNFKLFLILILPFIIQLIGFTYTKDYSSAVFSTEKRLGLLLFPLVFFFCKFQIHQDDVFKCITWFIWGLTFCLIISLSIAFYNNYLLNSFSFIDNKLFAEKLLQKVGIDHLTYGLYASFAINAILYFWLNNFKIDFKIWVPLILISVGMLLLIPKMGVISLIFGFAYLLKFSSKKLNTINILVLFFLIICITLLVFQLPNSKERIRQLTYGFNRKHIVNDPNNYSATRAGALYCSIDLLQEYGKFGLGTGGVEREMNNWFVKNKLERLVGLDTHNQYFDYLLSFGLLGLLILILSLAYPFYLFHIKGYYLFSVFIIIVSISFLTENYLNNNKGIMFFCFFNSLFASILKFKRNVIR